MANTKHRHSDMPPIDENVRVPTTPEMTAWQAAHEPLVTLRAWVREDGRVLVATTWAADITAEPTFDKPLEDMVGVLAAITRNAAGAALALNELLTHMNALMKMPVAGTHMNALMKMTVAGSGEPN